MKSLKLICLIGLLYSCTTNVNNTTPSSSEINSPSPKVSNSLNPSSNPKPTELPSITPSITISTPNPVVSITPKPIREIQKINVYSDDGTLLNQYNRYKMLLNETKTFKTEIIYKDGVVSIENINWSSNNSNVNVVESGKLETFLNNPLTTKAIITVSSENDSNYKYSFEVNLVDTLINKVPIYDSDCELKSYKDEPISRYYENIVTLDYPRMTTLNGKVYDTNGVLVDGALVKAKSIDARVNWVGEAQLTIAGAYVFRNVPVGVRIVTIVEKDDWTTRTRSEILTSGICSNILNFKGIYAIQDEPEITSLKINGTQVLSSSDGDIFNETINKPKNLKPNSFILDNTNQVDSYGNVPELKSINSNNLEVEMVFSEPIKVDDIRNYFRIISQNTFNNRYGSFTIDGNYSGVQFIVSEDEKTITFKTNKGILSNKEGQEARYLIDFIQAFRDKTDKSAIDRKYFRFSPTQINDFAVFSVKNDENNLKLLGIVARDGGLSNDTIELRYSEPMELINLASYSAGLSDPLAPSNLSRQLWYRDANDSKTNASPIPNSIEDNNGTLVGFISGSDNDINQFKVSYMISKILSSEILNTNFTSVKASILGDINRVPNKTPVKGNSTSLLRNAKVMGSNVLLEFSPDAFNRDDKIIVSVGKRITGNFVDRNRIPSLNDDLSISTSGISVEYASIYDPAGRLIDNENYSSIFSNIDVNNSQRVATAS